MKKILNLSLATLATLAIASMATSASANCCGRWAASVRGDVGPTGSQVILDNCRTATDRDDSVWDFTGRLVLYANTSPCSAYIAGSWQGSNHTVRSRGEDDFDNRAEVRNDFSKAKVGMGFTLFKNHCLAFGMEFGGSFLSTKLEVEKDLFDSALTPRGRARTNGAGLYTNIKGEYKFNSSCMRNWSIYGKAEVADIIGHQRYNYCNGTDEECYARRYNNIVEIDLEAALVYSPCCKLWCDSTMNVAFGVRTDSFVDLYRYVDHVDLNPDCDRTKLLSLARPTLFLEVGLKM